MQWLVHRRYPDARMEAPEARKRDETAAMILFGQSRFDSMPGYYRRRGLHRNLQRLKELPRFIYFNKDFWKKRVKLLTVRVNKYSTHVHHRVRIKINNLEAYLFRVKHPKTHRDPFNKKKIQILHLQESTVASTKRRQQATILHIIYPPIIASLSHCVCDASIHIYRIKP